MANENSMLQKLQKNWMIESLDFHVKGYWELDSEGKIFDLRTLQSKEHSSGEKSGTPYLTTQNSASIIQFEPNSFYEIERLDDQHLVLTYFVLMTADSNEEIVRVFTIRLKLGITNG